MGWYESLVSKAEPFVDGEQILGVGVFEPSTAVARGIETLHGTDTMGAMEHRTDAGVPQHCFLAVTPTKVHVIGVTALPNKNLATVSIADPQPFAVIDRSQLDVAVHRRKVFPSTLLLHDKEHDVHYHLLAAAQKHLNGTAVHVFDALADQAVVTDVDDGDGG